MKVEISKKQYLRLLQQLYLGNWMANANRNVKDRIVELDKAEEHFLSKADKYGLKDYVEYSMTRKKYFPTMKLTEEVDLLLEQYNNATFWNELPAKLAKCQQGKGSQSLENWKINIKMNCMRTD